MGFFDGDHCIFKSRKLKTFDPLRELTEASFELIGTFLFAFFGSLATDAPFGNGLALCVTVYCVFMVSGGKLNPVVSVVAAHLDLWENDYKNGSRAELLRIVAGKTLLEITAQVSGAILGTATAEYLLPGGAPVGCFAPPANVLPKQVFGLEAVSTFLLVLAVLSLTTDMVEDNKMSAIAPFAIGLSLFVAANAVGPVTGGCLNPARYAGAYYGGGCASTMRADVFGSSYIIGEFVGALLAFVVHAVRAKIKRAYGCGNGVLFPSRSSKTQQPSQQQPLLAKGNDNDDPFGIAAASGGAYGNVKLGGGFAL